MCRVTTRSRGGAEQLKKEDQWVEDFDVVAFAADIKALGDELEKQQGDADVRHLNKMIGWSNACAAVGLLTMGLGVNFVSVFALSTWTFTRWTMIAHHTCHGGYDRVHPNKGRWNRFKFAVGSTWRRVNDWLGKWRKIALAFGFLLRKQSIVKIIESRTQRILAIVVVPIYIYHACSQMCPLFFSPSLVSTITWSFGIFLVIISCGRDLEL